MNEVIVLLGGLVKGFEGLAKLVAGMVHAYLCPAGYPTQGYGLLVRDLAVEPITPAEAERRVYDAMPYYIGETLKLCPNLVGKDPRIIAAVADFVFNLGPQKFRASTFRRRLLDEDWDGAIVECRKWVRGGGRVLRGLVLRREAEARMIGAVLP